MTLADLPRTVALTPAEAAVVAELAADGPTNAQIARRLGRSEETVRSQLRSVSRKAHTFTRTELAVAVLRRRITIRVTRRDDWQETA